MRMLETERLYLRDWVLSDLDDLAEIWTNPNATIPQGDLPKQNKEDCLQILNFLIEVKNNYALVLKSSNKVIGSIGLNEDSDGNLNARNLGYILNEDYWNKGYMQEALKTIIDNAFEITPFLSVAFPALNINKKSLHIAEKLGFKFIKTVRTNNEPILEYNYYVLDLNIIS